MSTPCPVYTFRSGAFACSGNTVVSVAPLDAVASVYNGEDGLSAAFAGGAVYRNDETGERFVGVWGARNASRFRSDLRAHMQIVVLNEAPDARLSFWSMNGKRPKRPGLKMKAGADALPSG